MILKSDIRNAPVDEMVSLLIKDDSDISSCMTDCANELKSICEHFNKYIEAQQMIGGLSKEAYLDIAHCFHSKVYKTLCRATDGISDIFDPRCAISQKPRCKGELDEDTALVIDGNEVVLKTPHLLSVNREAYEKVYSKKLPPYFNDLCSKAVNHIAENEQYQFPEYADKNITVASAYEKNRKKELPDADNLYSKHIIDALLSHMKGTDSGATSTISKMCFTTSEIQPASYIIITPGYGKFLDEQCVKTMLSKYFPVKSADS